MSGFEGIYPATAEDSFICPPMTFPTREEFKEMCKKLWEPRNSCYIVSPTEYALMTEYEKSLKRRTRNKKKAERRRKAGK